MLKRVLLTVLLSTLLVCEAYVLPLDYQAKCLETYIDSNDAKIVKQALETSTDFNVPISHGRIKMYAKDVLFYELSECHGEALFKPCILIATKYASCLAIRSS